MSKLEDSILNVFDQMFNLGEKEHRDILLMYKDSRDNINDFIAKVFIKYGQDGKINYADLQKYNRMATIENEIKNEIQSLHNDEVKKVGAILGMVYAQSFYRTAYELEKNLKVGINFKLLKPEFVKEAVKYNWSGVPFSERIWKNQNALIYALRTELTQGIQNGESLDKISKRVKNQFDVKSYQSLRLIRTESSRIISSAQEKLYSDSGVTNIVRWTATLDSKTDSQCARLDGKTYEVDDPSKPRQPVHPNCRCCWTPVLDDYQPTKRKDNQTKEIIDHMSYDEWAKQNNIPN